LIPSSRVTVSPDGALTLRAEAVRTLKSASVYEFVYAPVGWPAFAVSDMAITRQPFEYVTELQCHSAAVVAPAGEAGPLCFISSNLAGCSLLRIGEEELIAVEIIDQLSSQQTVARSQT
jgi:hypothetical protein